MSRPTESTASTKTTESTDSLDGWEGPVSMEGLVQTERTADAVVRPPPLGRPLAEQDRLELAPPAIQALGRERFVPEEKRPPGLLESVVLTLAVPGVGWLINPRDPFFLESSFPWLVFAPLLVALRHGFTLGLACVVGLDIALVLAWRTQVLPMTRFPGEPLVGLFAVAMVAGQFTDVRTRRITRMRETAAELQRRAGELARAHFLLELSHTRLSEQVGRTAGSLRDAIANLCSLAGGPDRVSLADHGDAVMGIFSNHCGVEIGELFLVEGGELWTSCARLGRAEPLDEDDPIVARALQSKQLVHVPAVPRGEEEERVLPPSSPVLAAVPFEDERGHVRALLCVQAMPFASFQRRNLETMATLARHISDLAATPAVQVRAERRKGLDVARA